MSEKTESITEQPVTTPPVQSFIPPSLITRNVHGLIDNGSVNYIYTPEGLIDWRAMINPKHLAINKFNFEKKGRPVPDSLVGLEDRDLLILLPGIKELAQIRGYTSVKYTISSPSKDYVLATCTIAYIPNFETENREVYFSAIGDASIENTTNFGRNFLGPIAENRAFVRAVRNFLRINIVGQEEIGGKNPVGSDSQTVDPAIESMLRIMDENGVTFDKIKAALTRDGFPDADKLENLSQIPAEKRFELVGRIKAKAKQKTDKKPI